MALQFRGVVPYTLSGVLAIIGCWWFFSRKKNRSSNQSGCPVANEQDQCTETIPAEGLIGVTSTLLQQNQDEIPQSCIAISKSLSFGICSKLPTFGNPSESRTGEEHLLNAERLLSEDILSTEIGVLDGASNSQESLLSNPLKPSSIESAQELHGIEKKLFHQIENAVYKDVQNVTIDLKYPEDGSFKSAILSTAEDEMGANICNVAVLGKLTEIEELSPMARAICVHGDSDFKIYELGEVAPHEKIEMSSEEQEVEKTAVVKEMSYPPACSKIDSPVSVIDAMLEAEAQYTDFEKIAFSDVTHKIIKENVVQHSECSEIGSSYNAAHSVFLHEDAVQHIECNDIIPASHPAILEANLIGYTECSENISVDACDQIVVVQERIFQNTEARDALSTDCIVHTLINKEAVHPTQPDGVSTNEDALALHQNEENKSTEVSVSNLVDEGHTTIVPQETALQAAKIDVYSCYKVVTPVIEESASSFMELKEMDNADDAIHTELATVVQLPEFDEIIIKKDVTQPCAAPAKKHSPLNMYSEGIATVVQNALPLERDAKAAKFVDPLTADQGSPIEFPSKKDLSADLTKIDCSQAPTKGLLENLITHAELPTIVPKHALTAGMVQSTESSTITSTGETAQYELRKHYFDGKTIHTPALDVGINFDISLAADPKESIVVGMLMNSYVESPPLLKEENVCEPTDFSHCPWKGQQLESTEAEEDGLQMAKEIDFAKREAEAIEQLAMRIVSQVILAATREILSSAVVDLSGASCHVIENKEGSSLGLENGIALPCPISGVVNVLESNMHSNISKNQMVGISLLAEHLSDDGSNLNAFENLSLSSPKKATLKDSKPKCSVETDRHESKDSVSPTLTESSDPNITAEDSGCSACTSEDGINVEDSLQSTGLSTTVSTVELFDSLNTSGIAESNTEHGVLTVDTLKSSNLQGNINAPNSDGEMKRNSPDVTQERHWSMEMEADHSGGSDVNSMDSVDSGCALGKTESNQDTKPGLESKKSDLTVWEVEVPKHLVGRLIGKQGRYVSFLKQTSGAKIYISTLPYTQEFQICHIEGTQMQVDKALNQIGKKFKELNLTNIYAPPPLTLPSLPMTSWLMLPDGVTVEVIVVNVVNAGHMFVQQHTHPTFHALRSLDQQMFLCYSQPGIPVLPTPVEVGVICAAPGGDKAWWRAQVVSFYKESKEVEIRYVDYGGYERVKVDILRQIRSDFVTLPFQGSEVLLDNVIPLPDEDHFSSEADVTVNEMTRGSALLAQVTNYDGSTGLPLIQLWSMLGDEVVSINRALVERGFAQWIDSY